MKRQAHTPACPKKDAEGGSKVIPKEVIQKEVHPKANFS